MYDTLDTEKGLRLCLQPAAALPGYWALSIGFMLHMKLHKGGKRLFMLLPNYYSVAELVCSIEEFILCMLLKMYMCSLSQERFLPVLDRVLKILTAKQIYIRLIRRLTVRSRHPTRSTSTLTSPAINEKFSI